MELIGVALGKYVNGGIYYGIKTGFPDGKYLGNTAYFIPTDDLYLLGVLNSSSVWSFCKEKCSVNGDAGNNGRLRLFKQFFETIPIPPASKAQQKAISKLVQKCLERAIRAVCVKALFMPKMVDIEHIE